MRFEKRQESDQVRKARIGREKQKLPRPSLDERDWSPTNQYLKNGTLLKFQGTVYLCVKTDDRYHTHCPSPTSPMWRAVCSDGPRGLDLQPAEIRSIARAQGEAQAEVWFQSWLEERQIMEQIAFNKWDRQMAEAVERSEQ